MTQSRCAKLVRCNPKTVVRKLFWLSQQKDHNINPLLDLEHIQIDELESIEHTKLKPLTIPLCVSSRFKILGFSVGQIPAKGKLAHLSRAKYGVREDEREKALTELFENLKKQIAKDPISITTDSHPMYPRFIKRYFPGSEHVQVLSRDHLKKKQELVYSAERKKVFDPLFALNHRCGMLRSDMRRLTRKSWCTTKKIKNLRAHLELYKNYHNEFLVSVV